MKKESIREVEVQTRGGHTVCSSACIIEQSDIRGCRRILMLPCMCVRVWASVCVHAAL